MTRAQPEGVIFPRYSMVRDPGPGRRESRVLWELPKEPGAPQDEPPGIVWFTVPSIDEPVERKYNFVARSVEHQTLHTHDDAMVFLAKDRALPATLRFYREECARLGVEQRQLDGIDRLIERVEAFQVAHPGLVKVADVEAAFAKTIAGPNVQGIAP